METGSTTLLEPVTATKTRYSPRWRVLGLNDDVTPMAYVVMLLIEIFHKDEEEAYKLMMEVHEKGVATFYVGTRESCELKVEQVKEMNRKYEQLLQVRMEPLDDQAI